MRGDLAYEFTNNIKIRSHTFASKLTAESCEDMASYFYMAAYSLKYSSYFAMASFMAAGLGAPLVRRFSTQVFKDIAS